MTLYFLNKVKFKNSELDIYDTGRAWHAKNHKHLIKKLFPKSNWVKKKYSSWEIKDKYKIIITNSIQRNCLKKELNK